jgi:AAA+ superfamily predicted ATPase
MTLKNTEYSNSKEKSLNDSWRTTNPAKPNTEALEILFTPIENKGLDPSEVPFVLRVDQYYSKLTLNLRPTPAKLLTIESFHRRNNYLNIAKLAYPNLWEGLRSPYKMRGLNTKAATLPTTTLPLVIVGQTTQMGLVATNKLGRTLLKPLMYVVSKTSWAGFIIHAVASSTVWTVFEIYEFIRYQLIQPVILPVLDPLIGDEWSQGRAALETWFDKQRAVLGRSRGNTYISAFLNRWKYSIAYLAANQFYFVDQFIKSSFTIRRAIQSTVPITVLAYIAYSTARSPEKVPNRAVTEVSKSLKSYNYTHPNIELRAQFEEEFGSIPQSELFRTGDGFLFNRYRFSRREFIGGEYVETPQLQLRNIIHPRELERISIYDSINPSSNDQDFDGRTMLSNKIGTYEWEPEEADQIPLQRDDEGQLTGGYNPNYYPTANYNNLQQTDKEELKGYLSLKKRLVHETYQEDIEQEETKRFKKRKEILTPYVKHSYEMLNKKVQKFYEKYNLNKLPGKHINIPKTFTGNLMLLDSPIYCPPWETEYLNYESRQDCIDEEFAQPENTELPYDSEQRPQRLIFSPFSVESRFCLGMDRTRTLEVEPPVQNGTTKLFHYGFGGMANSTETFGLSTLKSFHQMEIYYNQFLAGETAIKTKYPFLFRPTENPDKLSNDHPKSLWSKFLPDENNDEKEVVVNVGPAFKNLMSALEKDPPEPISTNFKLINDNDFVEEEDNEFSIEDPFGNEEELIEETEDLTINTIGTIEEDETDLDTIINKLESTIEEPITINARQPLWFGEGNFFLNQYENNPWNLGFWGTISYVFISNIIFYALIETCLRLECEGVRIRLVEKPNVHRTIQHVARMPEAVRMSQYVGETIRTVSVRKLLLAFQAKRGVQLYGQGAWGELWIKGIRPMLSPQTICKLSDLTEPIRKNFVERNPSPGVKKLWLPGNKTTAPRNLPHKLGLPESLMPDIKGRYFHFDKVVTNLENYIGPTTSNGNPITPTILTERQKTVNRLGGEQMVIQGLQFGTRVQDEVCNFPLLALIKPGTYRMNRLPKGMILLGDSGNGRAYFVRTLATEARLPLLITESNRYLHPKLGLVRLKTLFKRARDQAPNMVFISDMDFMTRHRERYPSFGSVRATTHLLMAMDGFSSGDTNTASERNIFVMGSMETTALMDDACLRSGRFEWVLRFYYPPVKERYQMLKVHSKNSIVNTAFDVDWEYYAKMTYGFSCLDIRALITTSAMYALKTYSTAHTGDTIAYALGRVNHMHDLNGATFIEPVTLGLFERADFAQRREQATQHAPFFTQTGHVPMYKKLTNLFRVLAETEGDTLNKRWASTLAPGESMKSQLDASVGIEEGLVAFLCEGLFLYNTQKAIGPYPFVAFNTYCSPVFDKTHAFVKKYISQYSMERRLTPELFITAFDVWRHKHPTEWKPTGLLSETSISTRSRTTAMWRSTRFKESYSIIGGLTELENEFIFGVSPIANKIKNRMSFIGTKGIESYSRDSAIFGTFETNSDLSFKCRKDTTSRRVDQFSSELLGRFQKHRRSRNVTVKKFQKV